MNIDSNKQIIIIGGPTGVGKTSYAIDVAGCHRAEIFSADSRQIYQEMSIGTAKPSFSEREKVVHHMVDYVSIHRPYSVGDYLEDLSLTLHDYFKAHDVAVVCGGTGLYLDALMYGLDYFPDIPPAVREQLNDEWNTGQQQQLLDELLHGDPEYYHKVDKLNPRRVIRALEIIRHTGQPFSSFHSDKSMKLTCKVDAIYLNRSRSSLYRRIDERVLEMLANGLEEEARLLYPYRHAQALQTVGYQEMFDYFDGKTDRTTAVARIQQHSRRYAKRQLTWFRNRSIYREELL